MNPGANQEGMLNGESESFGLDAQKDVNTGGNDKTPGNCFPLGFCVK